MSLATLILAVSVIGVSLFLIYDATRLILDEFDIKLNLSLPKVSFPRVDFSPRISVKTKSNYRHDF